MNPHVRTGARNELITLGILARTDRAGIPWYHLATTPKRSITTRLKALGPIHAQLQEQKFTKRLGQTLEIAVYRALLAQPSLHTFGAFLDLDDHDDSTLYKREEPPSSISGKATQGKLDFVVVSSGTLAGVEVRNVRDGCTQIVTRCAICYESVVS